MKVIEPGHVYEVMNLEHPGTQLLTFVKRSSKAIDYGNTEHPGTNSQEVMRVVIDVLEGLVERTLFLDDVIPCDETPTAATRLENAIQEVCGAFYEYEARAWRRKQEKLNKEAGKHSEQDVNAHRDGYNDVPFTEHNIHLLPVGPDGHVIPPPRP